MTEQSTQENQVTEEEKKFNRQVNYLIMRYMWQQYHRKGTNNTETIYDVFNTSRERYTRIINTGVVRYKKNELDFLTKLTGLERTIFTGERRFVCLEDGEETVTLADWEHLFEKRADLIESNSGEQDEHRKQRKVYDAVAKPILSHIANADKRNKDSRDFMNLCYFLSHKAPAPPKTSYELIREVNKVLASLTFSVLDDCGTKELVDLAKLLAEKQKLAGAIAVYKREKEK